MSFTPEIEADPVLFKQHMRAVIKEVTVGYFKNVCFPNRDDLIEKNMQNIEIIVDGIIERYEEEVGLFDVYMQNKKSGWNWKTIKGDISDMFDIMSELTWVEE
jgi:hypothetical protein